MPARARYVPAVLTADAITLHGMRFHTRIGILPHEGDHPQPLEVDLTIWLSRDARQAGTVTAAAADAPPGAEAAVDYRDLYAVVADVVSGRLHYLEEVAAGVAERVLGLAVVERVRVAVRKPHVALPGPLAYAEVMVERARHA